MSGVKERLNESRIKFFNVKSKTKIHDPLLNSNVLLSFLNILLVTMGTLDS